MIGSMLPHNLASLPIQDKTSRFASQRTYVFCDSGISYLRCWSGEHELVRLTIKYQLSLVRCIQRSLTDGGPRMPHRYNAVYRRSSPSLPIERLLINMQLFTIYFREQTGHAAIIDSLQDELGHLHH